MKHLLTIILAIFILAACQENNNLVNPDQSAAEQPTAGSWIEYSSPLISSSLVKVKTKEIRWRDGGNIIVKLNRTTRDGRTITAESHIRFRPESWNRRIYGAVISFEMDLSARSASVTFDPHMTFIKPPIVNARFEGIKLDRYDLTNTDFAYQAEDGSIELIPRDKINVNLEENILEVVGAEVPHFSRYGFLR